MPEGDTIFRAARTLNLALQGQAVTKFETLSDNPSPDDIAGLLQAVKSAYDAIQGISTAPLGVDAGAFLTEIVERLFELLLTDYLALEVPTVYRVLWMTNVIRLEQQSAGAGRPSSPRRRSRAWRSARSRTAGPKPPAHPGPDRSAPPSRRG